MSTPTFFGIYAPAGTPKPIIDKVNAAIVKVGSKPEFQKRNMIAARHRAGAQLAGAVRQGDWSRTTPKASPW